VYEDKRWIGWPELVGAENMFKKEYLDFDTFSAEVKRLYPGEGPVHKWYNVERLNHINWPSDPYYTYKNSGWIGWPKLIWKVKLDKKEYPNFDTFSTEVKSLYPGEGDVQKWYNVERQYHSNWPSNPNQVYKNKGWIGWSELVGKENRFKK
jgi:hypothetical protein